MTARPCAFSLTGEHFDLHVDHWKAAIRPRNIMDMARGMNPVDCRPLKVNWIKCVSSKLLPVLTLLFCHLIASASNNDLRIDADVGPVISMAGEDNTLWIGTPKGLFRWDDTHKGLPELVTNQTGTVYVLQLVGNTLWIGSEKGLFRWDGPRQGSPQRIAVATGSVGKLYACGPTLLIGAKGLFIWPTVKTGRPTKLNLDVYPVRAFHRNGAILWVGSGKGLLRWDCDNSKKPEFTSQVKGQVTSLSSDGSTLLIGTSQGLLRWTGEEGSSPEPVLGDSEVFSIFKDGSTFLISVTGKGLFRWENIEEGDPQLIDRTVFFSSRYCRTGSILWMAAGTGDKAGLFRWNNQKEDRPHRLGALNVGPVHAFHASENTLWIGAEKGLYRLEGLTSDWDARITITSELPKIIYSDYNLLIQWRVADFGRRTTPMQVQYRVIVKDAAGREVQPDGPDGFKVSGNQELTLPQLPKGDYSLYVQATDLNDKVAVSPALHFKVYSSSPDLFSRLGIGAIVYVIFIFLVIVIAPFNSFCHSLLMNPWVRGLGSFLLIPIFLTIFPFVRRHILMRYLRAVRNEKEFSDLQAKLVIPTEALAPDTFGARLSREGKLLLLGQAGIGKTFYFKYLTGHYARENHTAPGRAIPVFFPLSRYQGEAPANIFSAQLSAYGQLIDKDLNNWFMQKGGFLIFIDGLNEVDESTRNKISAFVDQYSKTNYFCISSQHHYPEFSGIGVVRLESLSEDKIIEFLQQRLGNEQAQAIAREFGGNISQVYQTPHDLEFAIESKKRHPELPIPHSKTELYELTLAPIVSGWLEEGRTDYPDLLFHRAYDMLCSRDPFFDNSSVTLPDDLRDRLVENRYLLRRSGHYLFRHDLVRSFLASKYFRRHWPTITSEEALEIDDSWRTMLEFTFLSLKQPEEARNLLDRILVKNRWLAGELFSWLNLITPALSDVWATDFKIKYADATLTIV